MITFNNWRISCTQIMGRQYDNMTQRVEVVGDLPDGYAWVLLVECGNNKDTLLLERTDSGAEVVLTKDNLSISGNYTLQLRGSLLKDPNVTRHTNTVQTYVSASLTGVGEWPKIPTEFAQIEQRLMSINSNPPVPSESGYWMIWNPTTNRYEESTILVGGGGYVLTKEDKQEIASMIDADYVLTETDKQEIAGMAAQILQDNGFIDNAIEEAIGSAIGGSY